jgi:hypothetical protein
MKLQKFYKVIIDKMQQHLANTGVSITRAELDNLIKYNTFGEVETSKGMSQEELKELVYMALAQANAVGLNIDFPSCENDDKLQFIDLN